MKTSERLEELKADHRARIAAIRADEDLSWEAKERRIREAGREYDRRRAREPSESEGT